MPTIETKWKRRTSMLFEYQHGGQTHGHVYDTVSGYWFCLDCESHCQSDNPCVCCDIAEAEESANV